MRVSRSSIDCIKFLLIAVSDDDHRCRFASSTTIQSVGYVGKLLKWSESSLDVDFCFTCEHLARRRDRAGQPRATYGNLCTTDA